ncbi:BON domain-containing protein [Roseateles oligotrophus]|uniref:BON domain-containing protein n=1 Tax=Roseateles oligotrophus TaxID=1769250 RepID=A0ABT2YEX0_9BURK|nr:BON domain-containing protein [Roseateles oligotrophus]MCV2368577.1 BON domain-containing protein [Roseateles oligotrophus]
MSTFNDFHKFSRLSILLLSLAGALASTACVPLAVGGAMVGGGLMATDRRTSGTQVEDEGIEYKAGARVREQLGDRVHVNINSYNRLVLITGETRTEADRLKLEQIVAGVENVSHVLNETAVTFLSSYTSRSTDVLIAAKVKASLVDAPDLISNAFYVVVERGAVFIMGRVTEREAARAVNIARGVSGVSKVVRAVEIISEEELARLVPPQKPATDAAK